MKKEYPRLKKWIAQAEAGHRSAMWELGRAYLYGKEAPRSGKKALYWLQKAADLGDPFAMRDLGDAYADGLCGLTPDPEKVRELYLKSEEVWPELSPLEGLAWRYINGFGMPQSDEEAAWCFRKMMEDDYLERGEAAFYLGMCYEAGKGVPQSYEEAARLYEEANTIRSLFRLGRLYKLGLGVEQSNSKAFQLFQEAVDDSDYYPEILHALADCYERGEGVVPSIVRAKAWRVLAEREETKVQRSRALDDTSRPKRGLTIAEWLNLSNDIPPTKHRPSERIWVDDTEAQYQLARHFAEEKNVEECQRMATRWFRRAAERGHCWAQKLLGKRYRQGRGVEASDEEAARWLRKAAEQGDAEVQYQLGSLLDSGGNGVPCSPAEAFKWYRKAAKQDHAKAQNALGCLYHKGRGVKSSDKDAVKWWRKAAKHVELPAMVHLGEAYQEGRGVTKSIPKALEWYTKAAERGNTLAQFSLALLYDMGNDVPLSYTTALKWYLPAAKAGMLEAQYNLALIYHNDDTGHKSDKEAFKWFRKAAEHGYKWGEYRIAVRYKDGRGVKQSDEKAILWLRKAVDQGLAEAQYALAQITLKGECGLPVDREAAEELLGKAAEQGLEEALAWLRQEAEAGDVRRMCQLAQLYLNGKGVEKSDTEAEKWYRKAADLGDAEAQYQLGHLYWYDRKGPQKNQKAAIMWFKRAAKQGHREAMDWLGIAYRLGWGVKESPVLSTRWLTKAYPSEEGRAHLLFQCYRDGYGVKKSDKKALYWLLKAVEEKYDLAMIDLADAYAEGSFGLKPSHDKMREWIFRLQEENLPESVTGLYALAENYYVGYPGCPQSDEDAAWCFFRMADANIFPRPLYALGMCCEVGKGVPQSYKEAARLYRHASEHQSRDAYFRLGRLYRLGLGVHQSDRLAVEYFRKSVQWGIPGNPSIEGLRALAWCYETGTGVEPSAEKAKEARGHARKLEAEDRRFEKYFFKDHPERKRHVTVEEWLNLSNDVSKLVINEPKPIPPRDDLEALSALGWKHFGQGNPSKAEKYFRKAAEQGYRNALEPLAECYALMGQPEKEFEVLRKAAERGIAEAQYELAIRYVRGKADIPTDEAERWLRYAAMQGHAKAQHRLGLWFAHGTVVEKSPEKAAEWWQKAAEQGIAGAQMSLGWAYHRGLGVAQSDQKAAKWWLRAAKQGSPEAMDLLSDAYLEGRGVPQSDEKAMEWLMNVIQMDVHPGPMITLAQRYLKGKGVPQSYDETLKWLHKARKWEYGDAERIIARMYRKGQGVPQSDKTSAQWLLKAAKLGDREALRLLATCYKQGLGVAKSARKAQDWLNRYWTQTRKRYDWSPAT